MENNNLISQCLNLLCCPKDKSLLDYTSKGYLKCKDCGTNYTIHASNFIELMPRAPMLLPSCIKNDYERRYFDSYHRLFNQKFLFNEHAIAWGAIENISPTLADKKNREIGQILIGTDVRDKIICDVSGGAGWITLQSAKEANIFIHCDISCDNLNYVYKRSGNKNILFIRMDFFSDPFIADSIDIIFCTDTLIYGNFMVKRFLRNIHKCLSADGKAKVDFYNRLHRNIFHKPYMIGYSASEVNRLLREIGITKYDYEGFFQECEGNLKWIIPSTRHIVTFGK